MKSSLERLVTVVLIVVFACLSIRFSANADDEQTEADTKQVSVHVALLDVGRVFKESATFKEEMQVIREELADAQRDFTKQQEALAVVTAEHKQLTPGSKDYLDLAQAIATDEVKLKTKIARQKARTMHQEAEAYASHYNLLRQVVDEYAKKHKIRLVLRQNTSEMNPDEPKSVLGSINRFVIFEDQLDITDDILQIVNSN